LAQASLAPAMKGSILTSNQALNLGRLARRSGANTMPLPIGPFFVLALLIPCVESLQLPSVHVQGEDAATVRTSGVWWAQVDDKLYHAPTQAVSLLGLSSEVSHYYYALGSFDALTDEMKERRVGGEGRWHIFHLPDGPGALAHVPASGDRRTAVSALLQLRGGEVLRNTFPPYVADADYQDPLDASARDLEASAVQLITADTVQQYLTGLLNYPTRSWSNDDQSGKVQAFLQEELSALGYKTCLHPFEYRGHTLKNVVAVVPGAKSGSQTVTLGAHYDSRPFDGSAPGAEDNGSGVAALLTLAKAFASAKITPARTTYFVAFAGEEPGLLGSDAFVKALREGTLPADCQTSSTTSSFLQLSARARAEQHQAIIMDEVGWLSPKYSERTVNLETYDTCSMQMQHLRHATQLHNGDSLKVVHNSNPFGSDHMSWLNSDFRAVLTINADDEAYPHYHQSSDTVDNVNGDYVAQIGKMNFGGLLRMALP